MSSIIVRFRSKDGLFRLSGSTEQPLAVLLDELVQTKLPPLDSSTLEAKSKNQLLDPLKTLSELTFANGEMVELSYSKASGGQSISGKKSEASRPIAAANVSSGSTKDKANRVKVTQLAIDDALDEDKGLIPRSRSTFCRHTAQGMCEYCSPLPPWDQDYHLANQIKHISFHSYLAQVNSETNKATGGSFIPPLSESDYKLKVPCPSGGHEPWPKGICSKCQPSSITLKRQKYRMVDHVEFQRADIVNRFIDSWRKSGVQRIGLLVGTYDKYDKTPLGIKAKVEAIYEFPQMDWDDGVALQEWEQENEVMEIIRMLGLSPLGVIFTDLNDAGNGDGSVICKRHVDSFFLSSLEVIFATKWQLKFPNACKYSENGYFSSKFVTCVVSGNTSGEIDMEMYQASETSEALVKANLITASTHPSQVFVNKQDDQRYVPDIMYSIVNEYGLEVKHNAKPSFPVEYLLVSLTHGFVAEDSGIFTAAGGDFPIENRSYLGEMASMAHLKDYLKSGEIANFHIVLFLCQSGILSGAEAALLCRAVTDVAAKTQLLHSSGWKSLQTITSLS